MFTFEYDNVILCICVNLCYVALKQSVISASHITTNILKVFYEASVPKVQFL